MGSEQPIKENNDLDEIKKEIGEDSLSTGLKVLSFCIPLAGAIIYFINKDDSPEKAKSACHLALYGFLLGIVVNIIVSIAGLR